MARFLVVDGDHATIRAMSALLTDDGHAVAPFTSAGHAIDALKRESFDAVVADVDLKIGKGSEVIRLTRERHPDACLVAVTPNAEESVSRLAEAGVCMVADKPLDYDSLTKHIAECRARGRPDDGLCSLRARGEQPLIRSLRKWQP